TKTSDTARTNGRSPREPPCFAPCSLPRSGLSGVGWTTGRGRSPPMSRLLLLALLLAPMSADALLWQMNARDVSAPYSEDKCGFERCWFALASTWEELVHYPHSLDLEVGVSARDAAAHWRVTYSVMSEQGEAISIAWSNTSVGASPSG